MSDQASYTPSLIVFPHKILYLDGLQLSYLKVYEIIFHLWHSARPCFISNPEFCKRTGLAESTIREALAFFESKGEIQRVFKGRKRFIVQPVREIETSCELVDKSPQNSSKSDHPAEIAAPTRCQVGALPAAKSAHKITNINNTKLNKSFYEKENKKKHDWTEPPLASVEKQSNSYVKPERPKKPLTEKGIVHIREAMKKAGVRSRLYYEKLA